MICRANEFTGLYMIRTLVDKVLRQKTLNEITAVFHSNFNYDCHFMNEELEEEFERRFKSLGENIEK